MIVNFISSLGSEMFLKNGENSVRVFLLLVRQWQLLRKTKLNSIKLWLKDTRKNCFLKWNLWGIWELTTPNFWHSCHCQMCESFQKGCSLELCKKSTYCLLKWIISAIAYFKRKRNTVVSLKCDWWCAAVLISAILIKCAAVLISAILIKCAAVLISAILIKTIKDFSVLMVQHNLYSKSLAGCKLLELV
jgi:hypothetical protein